MSDLNIPTPVRKRGGKRPGAGRPKADGWQDRYLALLEERGTRTKCARAAGVDSKTVTAELARNPAFAERYYEALEIAADSWEEGLVEQAQRTGNPVGYIVRLKAERPGKYLEKMLQLNVNASVEATPADAKALLASMLSQTTPTTQRMLAAVTLDVTPAPEAQPAEGRPEEIPE